MKKKNGFTLVELLAILIILGIIAVITVPIISKILKDARINTAIDSSYGYVRAVDKLYYSKSLNDEDIVEDGIYTVSELKALGVSVDGREPSEGWVELEESEVVAFSIKIGDYVVTKYRDSEIVCEKGEVQPDEVTSKKMEISAKVDSYVKAALAANSSLTSETALLVSEISGVTTNVADSGWIHFNIVNNSVVVVDYSLTYGTITANYSSLTDGNYVSTFGDARKKPTVLTYGSEKCYGSEGSQECFKAIKNFNENGVRKTLLLANYCLKKDETISPITYKQNSDSPDNVVFSLSNYWHDSTNDVLKDEYAKDEYGNAASYSGNPYPYVYDSNSPTYEYVEGYLRTLKTDMYDLPLSATGRLLSDAEQNRTHFSSFSGIIGTWFWVGTVSGDQRVFNVGSDGLGSASHYSNTHCVRPVIIVPMSDL